MTVSDITYTKGGTAITGTPTDAGTYTAAVTVGGEKATVQYTIAQSGTCLLYTSSVQRTTMILNGNNDRQGVIKTPCLFYFGCYIDTPVSYTHLSCTASVRCRMLATR